ncbi:MAG TPA: 3'(2'),5'-bisphosphate nucleotidase CysQ [Acidimicrobiales bacterium]|nr:3'(2'),5'-bisphosphate nucleotidase CysQ [Acidimicrobiales bacterium]
MSATSGTAATAADHESARLIARSVGEVLLEVRAQLGFADPRTLGAAGDRRAEELLQMLLHERHPGDAVLSEESADDARRLGAPRVWVVDPLDGTREFSEEGRDDFAVHVALVIDGTPVCGAVALPARDQVLATPGPFPGPPPHSGPLRIAVSRTRPPALATDLAEALGAELVPMGSAGVKVMAVVTGEADLYVHGGGQYEWDSAAPVAVALAAGLHASRLDGSSLRYNQPDPWLPDLVVCANDRADEVLATVAAL